ncbi:protein C19orf12 homolog [Topomyia yanbarensis]|uniref:protein C19orf12 homolog n=1 Tax=Topomyia yanbarensis TaxID=2498891 RepID=UPI00273AC6B2|nr:protein C19orf12 homolog [Topomyia yanbarensis]XP_058816362.1 protein C19orf12 homolog [Topomyia yanbarensis]
MPINTRELMDAVGMLTDQRNVRVTVKSSAKGAVICGTTCFVGGLLAGPIGLAVGGTIGAVGAGMMSKGKFRSVSEIIMNEMSEREREQLKGRILNALSEFHPTDMAVLLPLIMGNAQAQQAILSTVISFVSNEMRMQIVD